MKQSSQDQLLTSLQDERSKQVIFVSHCILNENTRYLGGAFRPASVDELVDVFRKARLGICQMPCPEQRAWGGVLKRFLVPFYGSQGTLRYQLRHILLPLFLWYTWYRYWRLARVVAKEIEDYKRSGFEVVGIVGVAGSPSCGVNTTLNLRRSLEVVAGCPLAQLNRRRMNEDVVAACVMPEQGLFLASLRKRLQRKHLNVTWYEHNLLREMRGQPLWLERVSEDEGKALSTPATKEAELFRANGTPKA